jgi:hypothetical protein
MSYTQLTHEQRYQIYALLKMEHNQSEIINEEIHFMLVSDFFEKFLQIAFTCFMPGAEVVQMRYQSMEIIDSIDDFTPIYGTL